VDEINALKRNKVWRVVPHPNNALVIQYKWVFDVKVNPDSLPPSVLYFKARLVTCDDSQTKGINFNEATVNAFLNGKLSEKGIYMTQPEGFRGPRTP